MKRNLKIAILLLALVGGTFVLVSAFLINRSSEGGFPVLAPGSYIGVIEGTMKSEDGTALKIFAEAAGGPAAHALYAVLAPGWKSQVVSYNSGEGTLHEPLMLVGPQGRYSLVGVRTGNLSIEGKAKDESGTTVGSWRLLAMAEYPALPTSGELQQLRGQIAANARIREINEQIKASEMTVSQQKEEISKLQHYITEGESLKRNADKKYKEASDNLLALQQEIAALKKEADGLVQKLELSQRLTGMGKLVSLARKSTERESRWVDSMLRTSVADMSLELDSQVERGERILSIKNQIAEEHDKVFRLLQAQGGATE